MSTGRPPQPQEKRKILVKDRLPKIKHRNQISLKTLIIRPHNVVTKCKSVFCPCGSNSFTPI